MTKRSLNHQSYHFSIGRGPSIAIANLLVALGCSGNDAVSPQPTPGAGGAVGNGGGVSVGGLLASGGASLGGGTQARTGGAPPVNTGGTAPTGGQTAGPATGGSNNSGGTSASTGGSKAGGAPATGGTTATGGKAASGGNATGGAAVGGRSSVGGAATGGNTPTGGTSATGGSGATGGTCPFPTSFKWSSTGPLANPTSPAGHTFVSLKDFTVTKHNNQFVVYATVWDKTGAGGWSSVNMNFTDFAQMGTATQTWFNRGAVAPTLIYFTPKSQWVLLYQWGFQYATSSDPTNPSSWSSGKSLLSGGPSSSTGPIDQTVICDTTTCYLFFASDDGRIHRSSMPIGNFPGTFNGYTTILTDTQARLFEAVQVYSVKGSTDYLMIVEAMGGGGRYFRAFRATSLGGTFTAIASASEENAPFAGKSNVTFTGTAWTNDISHGDIVRADPSEKQPIDPCNMQFLYQGFDKTKTGLPYGEIPYRPGLLTKTN